VTTLLRKLAAGVLPWGGQSGGPTPVWLGVHYWKFQDDLADASGNGKTLTSNGNVVYAAGGKAGKAARGDPAGDGIASRVGDVLSGSSKTGTYTVAGWFSAGGPDGSSTVEVLDSTGQQQLKVGVANFPSGNYPVVQVNDLWIPNLTILGPTVGPFLDEELVHVALVIDAGAGKVCVNGTQVLSASGFGAGNPGQTFDPAGTFRVVMTGGDTGNNSCDELAVWPSAAKSAAGIADLYELNNAGLSLVH
jgi:hypothetical protein